MHSATVDIRRLLHVAKSYTTILLIYKFLKRVKLPFPSSELRNYNIMLMVIKIVSQYYERS